MASGNFRRVGRWALMTVAVAVVASVAMAAANVRVVSARPLANTAVVVVSNSGNVPASGTVSVTAMSTDGRPMQATGRFAVAAFGLATATVSFDSPVGSIASVNDCGVIFDDGSPL